MQFFLIFVTVQSSYLFSIVFIDHRLESVKYSIMQVELGGMKPVRLYLSCNESVYVFVKE
jgi:hypothetical protein